MRRKETRAALEGLGFLALGHKGMLGERFTPSLRSVTAFDAYGVYAAQGNTRRWKGLVPPKGMLGERFTPSLRSVTAFDAYGAYAAQGNTRR